MATDQRGTGPALLPSGLVEWSVLLVDVQDVNEVPVWAPVACGGGSYVACFSIAENSARNAVLGKVPVAVDPDTLAGQTLSYASLLDLNAANAQGLPTGGNGSGYVQPLPAP